METDKVMFKTNSFGSCLETFLSGMETVSKAIEAGKAKPLKPSLVEWKLRKRVYPTANGYTLKPSLVEWKLAGQAQARAYEAALKPSLVEWKLDFVDLVGARRGRALKPSLVEWKLGNHEDSVSAVGP